MYVIELNDKIRGNNLEEAKALYAVGKLEDYLNDFAEVLRAFEGIRARFGATEVASEFLSACPMVVTFMGKKAIAEEVFYAMKTGYFYPGVPAKLTYFIKKALQMYDTPNLAVSKVARNLWTPYLKKGLLPDGVTIKTVIDNICGYETRLLLDSDRAVVNGSAIEVYVPDVDEVLVLPKEYAEDVRGRDDLQTVMYDKAEGVKIRGHLFRTMHGKIGVTLDDFDLRECF